MFIVDSLLVLKQARGIAAADQLCDPGLSLNVVRCKVCTVNPSFQVCCQHQHVEAHVAPWFI